MAVRRNVVLDTMGDVFWCKRRSRERWDTIKKLIEWVGLLIDQVDVAELRGLGIRLSTHGDYRHIIEVN